MLRRQETFGYTAEDVRLLINPMAATGTEPVGSMGNDTPLAVLSDRPQLLYNYFKQLFAQVTNPPIDAIREEIVMAVETSIGPEGNLLDPEPEAARQLALPSPVLRNEELEQLRAPRRRHRRRAASGPSRCPSCSASATAAPACAAAIEAVRAHASKAIEEGNDIIILSDRGHDERDAPIPALLAVAAVHHHLLRAGTRTQVGPRPRVGRAARGPPLRAAHRLRRERGQPVPRLRDHPRPGPPRACSRAPREAAEKKYVKAITKGIVKVISKMGISAIQSYHGAQVFEAIGLNQDFVDEYFTWTPSRIGGVGIDVIANEVRQRHDRAYPPSRPIKHKQLGVGGHYQYREDGEAHLFNPLTIHKLQHAARSNDYERVQGVQQARRRPVRRACAPCAA